MKKDLTLNKQYNLGQKGASAIFQNLLLGSRMSSRWRYPKIWGI